MAELPTVCPYCGRKLIRWLKLTPSVFWELTSVECSQCKVKWVLFIDPKVLRVEERKLK